MNKRQASKWIQEKVDAEIDETDRTKLQEIVESELMTIHEGNIARFRLRLSDFNKWQKDWK